MVRCVKYFFFLFSLALMGCASVVLKSETFKTYFVGATVSSNVGDPFLVVQNGTVQTVRSWVGVSNSPDGWEVRDVYSNDYLRKELVYSGRSGDVVDISYREYRGGLAAPAFFQSLHYDLSDSSMIGFQNFQLSVVSANNSTISAIIVGD